MDLTAALLCPQCNTAQHLLPCDLSTLNSTCQQCGGAYGVPHPGADEDTVNMSMLLEALEGAVLNAEAGGPVALVSITRARVLLRHQAVRAALVECTAELDRVTATMMNEVAGRRS
jgi:hypothetical protein